MDIIQEITKSLGLGLLFLLILALIALRATMTKSHRIEEELRKFQIQINNRSLRKTASMIKYCGAPIELLMDELKELSQSDEYLASVPQDDIVAQVIDKYIRS